LRCTGSDGYAIRSNQLAGQRSQVDEEIRTAAGIDNPQTHPARLLYFHDLRIAQRSIIGKVGIVVNVIRVWLAHLHSPAGRFRFALTKRRKNLAGRGEAVVREHEHDFLFIARPVCRIVHDQWRCKQLNFLESLVRVHPMRAGRLNGEVVEICRTGAYRRLGYTGNSIFVIRRMQPVPVNRRRDIQLVVQPQVEELIHHATHPLGTVRLQKSERRSCFSVDVERAFDGANNGGLRDICSRLLKSGRSEATIAKYNASN
jgi:hypothetical protein